ncbi:MAG: DUF2254 family protein, partial [Anaerolineales bacterium]
MKRDIFILARGVVLMAAGMLLLMSLLLLVDLRHAGLPLEQVSQFNIAEARHLSNTLNRNFNQLTAVVFTTVAIAVPLTANMYSVKFLELFIQDPVNAAVLTFVVFANLNNTWWAYGLKDNFVPVFQIYVSVILLIVCFALLFPYLYYVFRFLHPNTLLLRLEKEISANLRAAGQRPARTAAYRQQVAEGIEHIANIAIRSIDRADRNTAIESVLTLERVARAYWSVKPRLAPNWFGAESETFLGFSAEAIEEIRASHSWVEMKLFSQLRQVMSAALTRMHDLVSTGAESLRKVGLEDAARCDVALREMVMEYFNTFIRLALTRRDVRSVFVLFDQYRSFAEALNAESPDLVEEIAYYFEYYGQVARELQLNFVVESAAHDLGRLVQH